MKTNITSANIRKHSNGYTVTLKVGRKNIEFDMQSYNAARSFVRRNFAQTGHYN
jgi:hypothetical protein